MSMSVPRPSRRAFLKQSTALTGAMVLGIQGKSAMAAAGNAPEVTHWVVIQPDDTVIIRVARSGLGQGSFTGLAQLVAEELECDWSKVRPEYADVNEHMRRKKIWKDMSTGGSRGIRDSHEYVRKGGAAAREMLIAAAAQQWKVPASECKAQNSVVTHPSGKRATYGQLAALAGTMPIPEDPKLKDPKDWKIAGKPLKRLDTAPKLNGSKVYGVDVKLPGMLCAALFTAFASATRLGSDVLETLTAMFNPLPSIALLPLSMIWFGLGEGSIVFVLIHAVLWAVALNTHAGFRSVSTTWRNTMMGAPLRSR